MSGVPAKILRDSEGHIVTCETKTGEVYRGKLIAVEDNMNCQMTEVSATYRDGQVASLDHIFIRGEKICFFILPDILNYAPMFKVLNMKRIPGAGSKGRWKSAPAARGRGSGMRGRRPGGRRGRQPGRGPSSTFNPM